VRGAAAHAASPGPSAAKLGANLAR
jgi:hypothetical protein